jgi:glycosyltransferase involved in cell wall biosynthesis
LSKIRASGERVFALDARLVKGTSTGDSTYWTSLVEAMVDQEHSARVLLFSDVEKPSDLQLGPRFQWVFAPAKSSRWWSLVTFPMLARSLGADVIHTQYSLSPLVGNRGVTTVHDISFFIGPEWFKPKDRFILSKTVPGAVRRAAKVITVSETSRKEIEKYMPAAVGKVAVTPLASPSWIQRVDRSIALEAVRAKLGVDAPFILTVGTRWPRKNMQLAVDAVSGLDGRFPHQLVVTGKAGWGEAGLGSRGRSVGYVDADTLSCLYSAAELYLAPSRHEGFGIPLMEAFRCGCPVVCSSGGALPEVAGDAGIVETSWEASDWAQAISHLLDDPSKLDSLRSRGLERERLFTWAETARRTLEVYREVAG